MSKANFKVDTRITSILGENYRSTEYALKELVDNSWDADSEGVNITMPEPFEKAEIIIEDDGSGMTEKEIRNEYLFIARSRTSRKGDTTPYKKRKVKGRKGIGKFAGLLIAGEMVLISKARGKQTTLRIVKDELLKWRDDLEKLDLPIEIKDCSENEKGTTIILKNLNQNLHFPNPLKLSQLLIMEYSRENSFEIKINDKPLDIQDLKGNSESGNEKIGSVGNVNYSFTISDEKRNLKQSGIAIRVDGKIIGKPSYFGLDEDDEIPKKLLKKIFAEVEVDGLAEDITADWGAVFENSKKLEEVQNYIRPKIKKALKDSYGQQIHLAKARLQKKINRELEKLPEYKRDFARRALDKVLKNYYNDSEEKINTVISVVLDTLEKDEYYEVLLHIEESADKEIVEFADALSEFGLVELSVIGVQAKNRNRFLDYFDRLILNKNASESDIHKSIETNLWILNEHFSLMASNISLNRICKEYLDKKFKGKRKNKRPDLVLCQDYKDDILLIELKEPNKVIGRDEQSQAEKYRDDLNIIFPNSHITILVLGKSLSPKITTKYENETIVLDSYKSVVSRARNRMNWLVKELKNHYN
ncbi:MAG: ATP-binding protein [Balneola sp.]